MHPNKRIINSIITTENAENPMKSRRYQDLTIMKTNVWISSLLFMLALVLTGCPDPDSVEPTPTPNPKPTDLLSPDEQKTFLAGVGEELIGIFNPNDQKKAVELADDLYNKYESYDWDAISEEFMEVYDDIYSSEFESFFSMPKRIINAINGKQKASLENLEILLTLSKFGYTIEFDDNTKSVKITKTGDAAIVAKFSDSNGTPCELKVSGEGKTINASYTYEDYHWEYPQIWDEYWEEWVNDYENGYRVEEGTRTIKVEVPSTIKMHLKQGSSSLVSFTFNWDTNVKDYVNTSLDMKVINLGFKEESKVSTTQASAVFSFTYNDKNIITAAANLPKYKLTGWEEGSDITQEEGEDWINEYAEDYEALLGYVGKGEAKLDILGKIQIQGGVTDGAALVDAYYHWIDKDYNNELDECNDLCKLLNKHIYLSIYYNKTTTEQAKLLMDVYEDKYGYDVEPIMQFPYDDSQIAVMTYFESSKFLGLIDLVEDLANSYIALDKNHLIFGENDKIEIDY